MEPLFVSDRESLCGTLLKCLLENRNINAKAVHDAHKLVTLLEAMMICGDGNACYRRLTLTSNFISGWETKQWRRKRFAIILNKTAN